MASCPLKTRGHLAHRCGLGCVAHKTSSLRLRHLEIVHPAGGVVRPNAALAAVHLDKRRVELCSQTNAHMSTNGQARLKNGSGKSSATYNGNLSGQVTRGEWSAR